MKRFLIPFLSLLALALSAPAQLVTIGPWHHLVGAGGGSNPATTTMLDCRNQKSVAVEVAWQLMDAGTALGGCYLVPSIDGVNQATKGIRDWNTGAGTTGATNNQYLLTAASTGTTTNKITTNIWVGPYPYLMVKWFTNNDTVQITNFTIKYFIKKNAR